MASQTTGSGAAAWPRTLDRGPPAGRALVLSSLSFPSLSLSHSHAATPPNPSFFLNNTPKFSLLVSYSHLFFSSFLSVICGSYWSHLAHPPLPPILPCQGDWILCVGSCLAARSFPARVISTTHHGRHSGGEPRPGAASQQQHRQHKQEQHRRRRLRRFIVRGYLARRPSIGAFGIAGGHACPVVEWESFGSEEEAHARRGSVQDRMPELSVSGLHHASLCCARVSVPRSFQYLGTNATPAQARGT